MNPIRRLVITIMILSVMQTIYFVIIDAENYAIVKMIIISIASVALCCYYEKAEKE